MASFASKYSLKWKPIVLVMAIHSIPLLKWYFLSTEIMTILNLQANCPLLKLLNYKYQIS